MKKPVGATSKIVYDSAGNEFKVLNFTKSLEGKVNGFLLQNTNLRGEKEVGLSEYKFYKHSKKKKR